MEEYPYLLSMFSNCCHTVILYIYIYMFLCLLYHLSTKQICRVSDCRMSGAVLFQSLCALFEVFCVSIKAIVCRYGNRNVRTFSSFHFTHVIVGVHTNGLWKRFPYIFNVQYTRIFKCLTSFVIRFYFKLSSV